MRMPDDRIPKALLCGQLSLGVRDQGGQRKRFKDNLKANLKAGGVPPDALESASADRTVCRQTVASAVGSIQRSRTQQTKLKRTKRKEGSSVSAPSQLFTCTTCGLVCKSRIGLHSHNRTHRRPLPTLLRRKRREIHHFTVQCSTMQYKAVQHSTMQCNSTLHDAMIKC